MLEVVAPHTPGDPMSGSEWPNGRLSEPWANEPVVSCLLEAHDQSPKANGTKLTATTQTTHSITHASVKGVKASDEMVATLNLTRYEVCPQRNH